MGWVAMFFKRLVTKENPKEKRKIKPSANVEFSSIIELNERFEDVTIILNKFLIKENFICKLI